MVSEFLLAEELEQESMGVEPLPVGSVMPAAELLQGASETPAEELLQESTVEEK